MSGVRRKSTLFEVVPALGTVSAYGSGKAFLVPAGFEHPGIELMDGINTIGRDPAQNKHVIHSSHVSRVHCELLVSAGKIWVKDLSSHNGTFINGEKITRQELKPGDRLGLSRQVTFVLAMDSDLKKPIAREVALSGEAEIEQLPSCLLKEDSGSSMVEPAPPPLPDAQGLISRENEPSPKVTKPGWKPPGSEFDPQGKTNSGPVPEPFNKRKPPPPLKKSASKGVGEAVDNESKIAESDPQMLLMQLEQQRNVLAILYQISLHCLMAENQKEIEKLLTNVLQRLVTLDLGFILYQAGNAWRASICPNSKNQPDDKTVRLFYKLALDRKEAHILEEKNDLLLVGQNNGCAMMVPLMLGEKVTGVIGAVSSQASAYTVEILDIMKQLANVSAAALRDRSS